MKTKTYFKSEKWLNSQTSSSTGSIVCYDGVFEGTEGSCYCTFVEIADCHNKVRLHRSHVDTNEEFLEKVNSLITILSLFKNHLANESPNRINSDNND